MQTTLPSKGRPRSVAAEAAILKAAESLMDEFRPAQISADQIAQRAGVSKATLYKWWPSKTHILLDAVLNRASHVIPLPDTGSAEQDFIQLIEAFIRFHKETSFGATVTFLCSEGMNDPEIMRIYNERYVFPRRALIRKIWERGVARGEIRADLDPELGLDMLYGPPVYRYIMALGPIGPDFAASVVRAVFEGARAR